MTTTYIHDFTEKPHAVNILRNNVITSEIYLGVMWRWNTRKVTMGNYAQHKFTTMNIAVTGANSIILIKLCLYEWYSYYIWIIIWIISQSKKHNCVYNIRSSFLWKAWRRHCSLKKFYVEDLSKGWSNKTEPLLTLYIIFNQTKLQV